jgi:hypothetical protein
MNFPEDSEVICIYGWSAARYGQALAWVNDERRVVFVSEEERESTDPRVKIHHLESPLQIEPLAKKIAWSAVLRKLTIIGGEGLFRNILEETHLAAGLILSEAADWGTVALKNARANRAPYRRGMELKGAFAGMPAIIVGAGPSLAKNGHLLKKFEDKALIFAGGTALNVIDVEPHFAASIDAAAPSRQFKMHPFAETPFCYQSRMNPENFALIHGPRLLFPDSSSDPINWLEEEESFDGGWTVGNFLTAVALHLGCDPIIFVGMDLCYTHNRKYAEIETVLPDGLVQVGDVLTQRDWLMAAKWTEAKNGPFINATEGGILSLPKADLESLLSQLQARGDLRKKVHEAIQKLPVVFPQDRWTEWDESLLRCPHEEEIVHQKLLDPLWQIWKPIFEREIGQDIELHKTLFFQQVLEEHIHG